MNVHDPNDAFDARVRAVHAQSLEQLSPRVQAQLAQRRRAAMQGAARRPSRRFSTYSYTSYYYSAARRGAGRSR